MAEVKQYIPISQLDETRTVNPTDVLIISQKENPTDQEYVSKKISIDKISENITVPAATTDKTGGFKLYADSAEQNGKPYYVSLNDEDEAYVKVPEADGKTITENNGKISVSKELKNLADDIDNLVKKNVANAVVEAKDGMYIAGFEQKNGKIEPSSVQYKELSGVSGLSVVNTFDNASTTTVPSTALTKSSIQAVDSKLNSLHKVAYSGDYNQLINKPKTTGFVDLTSDQSDINGIKTFQKCPCSVETPDGNNNQQLVNVEYLKNCANNLRLDEEVTFLWGNTKFGGNTALNPSKATSDTNWVNSIFGELNSDTTDESTYNWQVENISVGDKSLAALKLLHKWTDFDVIRICASHGSTTHYPTYHDVSVKKLINLAGRLQSAYGDTDINKAECATYLFYDTGSLLRINAISSLLNPWYFVKSITSDASESSYFNSIYGVKYIFKKV